MQAAVDELWTYTGEMFAADATELSLQAAGIAADVARAGGAVATARRRGAWPRRR